MSLQSSFARGTSSLLQVFALMHTRTKTSVLFSLIVVIFVFNVCYAQSKNELISKLETGYQDLLQHGKGITFSKKTSFYGNGELSKPNMETIEHMRYFGQHCYKLESDLTNGKLADEQSIVPTVSCINKKYLFTLVKVVGSKDWQLSKAIMLDQKEELAKHKFDPYMILNQFPVQTHYSNSFDVPIAVLFKHPACKIIDIKLSTIHDKCIVVKYSTDDATWENIPSFRCKFVGEITLDPDRAYTVKHTEEKMVASSMIIDVVRDVEVVKFGSCYLLNTENKTTTTTVAGKSNPKNRRIITHDYSVDSPRAESEFTLTHYGLPEPEGVVWDKPTPMYIWYLSIAGGAGVLMFLCGWLIKRRAKARAAILSR